MTWSFVVLYLFGGISRLDPSERLVAPSGSESKPGLATGPLAGTSSCEPHVFDTLIRLAIITMALCAVAALFAADHID